jgi:hypothetical protein
MVPLSGPAVQALDAHLGVQRPLGSDAHVFTYRGQPLTISYCYSRLRTYGRRCDVRISPHGLRHSCATLLLNAGAPVAMVQKVLGHQYIDTTLRYARLYDSTVAADYFLAMGAVERELDPGHKEARSAPGGDLLQLVDLLRVGTLSVDQRETVQALRAGILTIEGRDSVNTQ